MSKISQIFKVNNRNTNCNTRPVSIGFILISILLTLNTFRLHAINNSRHWPSVSRVDSE